MAKTFSQNMKTAILADLQKLVDSGVLNSASADDFSKLNPLDREWPGFPSAVVIPPAVTTSAYEDVANNLREYTWYIMVVTTPGNLPPNDPQYLEGLIDSILNVFDLDCTLQGTAVGAVDPAVLEPPGAISSNSVTYVIFTIVLKAKALVPAAVQSAQTD
jgi:hypothetical protein